MPKSHKVSKQIKILFMRTINNFLKDQISTDFSSKILGGEDAKPVLTTTGSNPAPFENLKITVEVKGAVNILLVKSQKEETTQTTITGACSSSNGIVICETR